LADSQHPILITGATGKTGRAVVRQLLEQGCSVRAIVRPGRAGGCWLQQLGAEIVQADLFNFEPMLAAMAGIKRAYFCPPFHPFMLQSAAVFLAAAREAGLEAIVSLSQWTSSPQHPALQTRQQWLVDRMFASVPGMIGVTVNPGYFADNYLRLIDFAVLLGVFPVLTGDSLNAPPSNEDIARVVVALLLDPAPHAGRTYRPTGPILLSARDMAGIVGDVLGRPILPLSLPLWMFFRAARLQGVSPFELSQLRYYIQDHVQGAFAHAAPNEVVRTLTGEPPEAFEATVRRYLAMPFARPTLGNRLRALSQFALVPFIPGHDLQNLGLRLGHPLPRAPRFAMANGRWRAEHGAPPHRPFVGS
jgi:NAD(P)H dehydrogenase (quinone)